MSVRRALIAIGVLVAALGAIAGMVRYTRHVEARLTSAAGAGTTLRFFRNPETVDPFVVNDLDGRRVSLASLRGKVVLVNFWATWCPPCREEIPDLVALQARYADQLQIIGVSQDAGPETVVREFAAAHRMNYPVVMSTPELERTFPGIYALPTTFVIDPDGRLVQKHIGMLNATRTELETRALAGLSVNASIERVEPEEKVRLENAAQANKIPGIDLAPLTPAQKTAALQRLNSERCSCGCNLTVAQCRVDDPSCGVSLPLARTIVEQIQQD